MENIKALQEQLKTKELSATKECPKCGEHKDRIEGFHVGTSMCKTCKREADMNRRANGTSARNSTAMLVDAMAEMAEKMSVMTLRMDMMEKALKRLNAMPSDDENAEKPKHAEIPKKKAERKQKHAELEKKFKSKSDDTVDDDSEEEVVKPKKKVGRPKKVNLDDVPARTREVMEKKREKKDKRRK